MHNWLQDSYPAATVTGTVTLSAFTTKMAVYCLARAFPGTEMLIYIGAVMTLFPIFFAEIENDLRRVLAYSLNNQLGFMVVGVGVGTELALNRHRRPCVFATSSTSPCFSCPLVRFCSEPVRRRHLNWVACTEPCPGPWYSVSSARHRFRPSRCFSGFVSKSLILDAAAENQYPVVWAVLVFASAGCAQSFGY